MYYFLNKKQQKNTSCTNFVIAANMGRYGFYCSDQFGTHSQTKMENNGFELMNDENYSKLVALQEKRIRRQNKQIEFLKLKDRADQIETCLSGDPVKIVDNKRENNFVMEVAELSGTHMRDTYRGCGKGTAYVKDGHVIAWHYGYQVPSNWPKDCDMVHVELSGGQICF